MRAFYKRLLVSTLLMLVALSTTAGLGIWQFTVAHRNDVIETTASYEIVSLSEVSTLGEYLFESDYGRAVEVSGQLNCADSVIVNFAQSRPAWQVCPLILENGSVVAVAFESVGESAASQVEIRGRIQPAHTVEPLPIRYEKFPAVESLNTDELALRWQANVHDGYIAAYEVSPAIDAEMLASNLYVWPPVGIQLRNMFYAWQWWIFAGFSVFIWAKYVFDEYRAYSKPTIGENDESNRASK